MIREVFEISQEEDRDSFSSQNVVEIIDRSGNCGFLLFALGIMSSETGLPSRGCLDEPYTNKR